MHAPVRRDDLLALLAVAPFGVCAASSEGTVVFWNRRAEQIAGVTATHAIGQRYDDLAAAAATALNGVGAVSLEPPGGGTLEWTDPDGSKLTMHFFDEDGASTDARRAPIPEPPPIARFSSESAAAAAGSGARQPLSRREAQILRLVASGISTEQMAADLGLSSHTVLNHIRSLRRKLNAKTKLDAVVTVIRHGLL